MCLKLSSCISKQNAQSFSLSSINCEFSAKLDHMPLKVSLTVCWSLRLKYSLFFLFFLSQEIMLLCVPKPTVIIQLFEVMLVQAKLSVVVSHASIKALPPFSISLQINIWLPLYLTRLPCFCWHQRMVER